MRWLSNSLNRSLKNEKFSCGNFPDDCRGGALLHLVSGGNVQGIAVEDGKMIISGKVHCFFEQSGTFKNEFIKLGIPAEDYDIQNNFGQTDHIVDLFKAIDDAYDGKPSLFDEIGGGI